MNGIRGHGFAAEKANHIHDKIAGGDNVKTTTAASVVGGAAGYTAGAGVDATADGTVGGAKSMMKILEKQFENVAYDFLLTQREIEKVS